MTARQGGHRPPSWGAVLGEPRLWAGTGVAAAVAAAAEAAWRRLAPGPAPMSTAIAAATAALVTLAIPLLPRTSRWAARGGTEPPVLPVAWAAALSPPQYGRGIIAFIWTVALLLWIWSAVRMFSRTLRADPPAGSGRPPGWRTAPLRSAAESVLGLVCAAAAWVALSHQGGAPGRTVWFSLPPADAVLGAAALLALLASAASSATLRAARDGGWQVLGAFGATWWATMAPFAVVCLLAASAWPVHPAPLQGVGLRSLVVDAVGRLGSHPPPEARSSGGPAAAVILVLCALIGAAAALGRGRARRRPAAPRRSLPEAALEGRTTWRLRWRMFWERWIGRLLGIRRPPPMRHGSWRPATAPPAPSRRIAEPVPAAATGERARVRAAYARFLREAASAGLARAPGHSPRRYLSFMSVRALPARPPLQSLTQAYEDARYSDHAVPDETAYTAELDARAAASALASEARRRLLRGTAPPSSGLVWSPPRGVRRRQRGE